MNPWRNIDALGSKRCRETTVIDKDRFLAPSPVVRGGIPRRVRFFGTRETANAPRCLIVTGGDSYSLGFDPRWFHHFGVGQRQRGVGNLTSSAVGSNREFKALSYANSFGQIPSNSSRLGDNTDHARTWINDPRSERISGGSLSRHSRKQSGPLIRTHANVDFAERISSQY